MNTVIQNDLAAMLTKGIGTDKNPEKVLFWLNKAAEQNFPEAQYEPYRVCRRLFYLS